MAKHAIMNHEPLQAGFCRLRVYRAGVPTRPRKRGPST